MSSPEAAAEIVRRPAAIDLVIAGFAQQRVQPFAAEQHIVAAAARQDVVSGPADQGIILGAAVGAQGEQRPATIEDVGAAPAIEENLRRRRLPADAEDIGSVFPLDVDQLHLADLERGGSRVV